MTTTTGVWVHDHNGHNYCRGEVGYAADTGDGTETVARPRMTVHELIIDGPGTGYPCGNCGRRINLVSTTVPHEPPAADRQPCDLAEQFGTRCSEPATPAKNGRNLCDRHEVERRAELCGITPQQWLRNIGHEDRIPDLFPLGETP